MKTQQLHLPFAPDFWFQHLAEEEGLCFLDSGLQAYGMGRFSFLCCRPWKEVRWTEGKASIHQNTEPPVFSVEKDPFNWLQSQLTNLATQEAGPFPFCGGAVGYLSYDLGRTLETLPDDTLPSGTTAGLRFAFFSVCLVFDHQEKTTWLVGEEGLPGFEKQWGWWQTVLDDRPTHLPSPTPFSSVKDLDSGSSLHSNFSPQAYKQAVRRVREYIRQGEVYQVNIAQRFSGRSERSPHLLYQRLREASPAPYAAYLDFGDEQLLSSSPEKLLTLCGRKVETRPIKGTRKRGRTPEQDIALHQELRESEKDRSELLMIVDLERNDLGRVSTPGTVETLELFGLETYATVIHQTATVQGVLREGLDGFDALKAMFPGGSITGAPKIRAMEVIEELEPHKRGIYTGAIGYISADGQMDFNIAIRTMHHRDGEIQFSVGGGIVWDSDPEEEFVETLVKARGMMQACGMPLPSELEPET